MEAQTRQRERLDVPPVAPIEQRIATMTRQRPAIGPAPKSSVLGRLNDFLPQLAAANQQLQRAMQESTPADFDIEHVDDDEDKPYIEMDLSCGVFDLKDDAGLRAAERAMEAGGGPMGAMGPQGDGASSDDSDDHSDNDDASSDDDGSDSGMQVDREELRASEAAAAAAAAGRASNDRGPGRNSQGHLQVAGGSGSGPPGPRAGRGRHGPAAARSAGGARRKVTAKRSKIIELS